MTVAREKAFSLCSKSTVKVGEYTFIITSSGEVWETLYHSGILLSSRRIRESFPYYPLNIGLKTMTEMLKQVELWKFMMAAINESTVAGKEVTMATRDGGWHMLLLEADDYAVCSYHTSFWGVDGRGRSWVIRYDEGCLLHDYEIPPKSRSNIGLKPCLRTKN